MNDNNHKSLPDFIYDYLGKYTFEELNESQKNELKSFVTEEEYSELHAEYHLIKKAISPPPIMYNQAHKKIILAAYDEKQRSRFKPGILQINFQVIGKIAAMLIMFGSGWILHGVFNNSSSELSAVKNLIDTVFVENNLSEHMYSKPDTVIKEIVKIERYKTNPDNSLLTQSTTNTRVDELYPNQDLQILSLSDLENNLNLPKGNSYKDDTLARLYKLTSL